MLYELEEEFYQATLKEIQTRALISHTNAHAVRGRPTLKDVQRNFRNGPVHDPIRSFSKVLTSSYEISNDSNESNIIENHDATDKSTKTDIKTDCINSEKKPDVSEVKNLKMRTTCQEDQSLIVVGKKAAILDFILEWTQKHLFNFFNQYFKTFLEVSIWILIFILMIFSAYEDAVGKVFVIFIVSFQLVLVASLLCTWMVVYTVLAHNFLSSLDDCDILEKN